MLGTRRRTGGIALIVAGSLAIVTGVLFAFVGSLGALGSGEAEDAVGRRDADVERFIANTRAGGWLFLAGGGLLLVSGFGLYGHGRAALDRLVAKREAPETFRAAWWSIPAAVAAVLLVYALAGLAGVSGVTFAGVDTTPRGPDSGAAPIGEESVNGVVTRAQAISLSQAGEASGFVDVPAGALYVVAEVSWTRATGGSPTLGFAMALDHPNGTAPLGSASGQSPLRSTASDLRLDGGRVAWMVDFPEDVPAGRQEFTILFRFWT